MTESPCINVCVLDDDQVCVGCGRTLTQIALWSQMSEEEKRKVVWPDPDLPPINLWNAPRTKDQDDGTS